MKGLEPRSLPPWNEFESASPLEWVHLDFEHVD